MPRASRISEDEQRDFNLRRADKGQEEGPQSKFREGRAKEGKRVHQLGIGERKRKLSAANIRWWAILW